MGENLKELNLNMGSNFDSKTISEILADVSKIDDFSKKTSKLDFYLGALEEEMRKIDAFKRELPNCTHLLKDAIERLKEEKLQYKGRETGPVMKEFIVLKSSNSGGDGRAKVSNDVSEKKKWMSCVQLWSTPVQYENNQDSLSRLTSRNEVGESNGCKSEYEGCTLKKRRGAFVPFKKASLSLSTPVDNGFGKHQEEQRKQRRCWSPELHRRFIDALHQLGGPKTATPKQIREVMKVDGLTNDEVKSHLQKYRIHIRKHPSSSGPSNYWWLRRGEFAAGPLRSPLQENHNSQTHAN